MRQLDGDDGEAIVEPLFVPREKHVFCYHKRVPFLKKVVVGEDEDAISHLIEAALGDAGWLCLHARDGEAVLELVSREGPDLLILDVLMPKLDGLETVRRLKADPINSKVPVLMLTSLGTVDDRIRGLHAGADDYLGKPFDLRELLARAQALTRISRRERDRSPVTDLPGPGALDEAIARTLDNGRHFALLFIEIDGFDKFAKREGWVRGETLIKDVALNLRRAVAPRPDTVLAHLGGDDFAVLAPGDGANALCDALQSAADEQTRAAGLRVDVTLVDSDGARTTADLADKVAQARARR
jgi:DNA-binding response OmpR family regulator